MITENSNKVYLPALGIACSLGVGKDAVIRSLFNPSADYINSSEKLISGKTVPVARIANDLPSLPPELQEFNSLNNRLLRVVLDEIAAAVTTAKAKYGASRVGVVLATSTSGMAEEEQAFAYRHQTGQLPEGYDYAQAEMGSPSMFAAKYLGLQGPAYTISTACTSGGKAMCSARRLINAGICDAVITGGVDTLCGLTLNGFDCLELLSEKVCAPFSQNRDGITIGEGAAIFLMTREVSAIEFAGGGESSDAYHISCPEPNGTGAEAAINEALTMAKLQPTDIAYINLHGTGTKLNDAMEGLCINRMFGESLPCSSTKAMTGHTLGASGAIEAAFLWLALSQEQQGTIPIPPHIWDGEYDTELPTIRFSEVGARVQPRNERFALMSTSFAFGGSNVSVILSKRCAVKLADLLPHNPPMVLLDEVVAHRDDFIHTTVTIQADSQFCENGQVPSYVAIEYMAQAVGVWNGLIARQQGIPPKIGFLVGSRRLTLEVPGFKIGEKLDVYGQANYTDGAMAAFDCWIEIQGLRVAEGGLNVYQP